ncbi:UvrD-helicase domain-containing protein [Nocardia sp. NPDC050713]|uniref:UvrD-helicase domain-containing protein n=1 Tax=Nocardia sp. NPDC050713 TaxID=3154511 RepID=UPI00340AD0D0
MVSIARERRRHWVEGKLATLTGLGPWHRRILSVALMESGWHLLVAREPEYPPVDRAAAFAVGRTGVFALVFADEVPGESELRSVRRHAEETFANLYSGRRQYVPHMIQVVLVSSADTPMAADGRFRVATAATLRSNLLGNDKALQSNSARHLAKTASARLSGYERITTDEAPAAETVEAEGLFTEVEVREHERDRMLGRPFAEWMTFLDPEQLALVNRNFNGPARFSGPAGTGKTVVALHRMARFAKHNSGRLLFTSFVKTLPTYHRSGFERLAPHVGDRAEFTSLHAWAVRFLRQRDVMPRLNTDVCDNAYSHTWLKAREHLADIKGTGVEYWKDELERVIKGRGVTSLKEYQGINRTGRNRVILTDSRRETVWKAIYEPYQAILEQHEVCDLNDVVSAALAELRRRPFEEPYGLVVVDEVQDFTLLELQLVHQIAGGRADSQLCWWGMASSRCIPVAGRCRMRASRLSAAVLFCGSTTATAWPYTTMRSPSTPPTSSTISMVARDSSCATPRWSYPAAAPTDTRGDGRMSRRD